MSNHKILSYQLRVEETYLRRKHEQDVTFIHQKVEPLKVHLVTLMEKIAHLETELMVLKSKKIKDAKGKYQTYKHQLQGYLSTLRLAQDELKTSLANWRQLQLVQT